MATKGELMRISHDVHVHTNLSSCSHDPEQTPANILQKAADLGLRTVGFADHLWVSDLPGASNWYRPQDEKHVLQIRSQLPAGQHSVRVLIGCESEFTGTACGIDAARAA
jgi:histidinol phosphatase-like PHP family hydrolase